jgi:hypothetical protein
LIRVISEATGSAGFGVLVTTAGGDPANLYVSHGAVAMLGHYAEQMVGEPLSAIIAPAALARHDPLHRRRQSGESLP